MNVVGARWLSLANRTAGEPAVCVGSRSHFRLVTANRKASKLEPPWHRGA